MFHWQRIIPSVHLQVPLPEGDRFHLRGSGQIFARKTLRMLLVICHIALVPLLHIAVPLNVLDADDALARRPVDGDVDVLLVDNARRVDPPCAWNDGVFDPIRVAFAAVAADLLRNEIV